MAVQWCFHRGCWLGPLSSPIINKSSTLQQCYGFGTGSGLVSGGWLNASKHLLICPWNLPPLNQHHWRRVESVKKPQKMVLNKAKINNEDNVALNGIIKRCNHFTDSTEFRTPVNTLLDIGTEEDNRTILTKTTRLAMLFDLPYFNTGTWNWQQFICKDYLSLTNKDVKRPVKLFSGHTLSSWPILNNNDYNNNRFCANGNFQMKIDSGYCIHRRLYSNWNYTSINKFILMMNKKDCIYKQNSVSMTTLSGIDWSMNKNDNNNDNNNNGQNNENILNAIDDDDDEVIKNCWNCHKDWPMDSADGQVKYSTLICGHCSAIQPLSDNVNYFTLFNIDKPNYEINIEQLHEHYLRLQQTMHPDRNLNRSQIELNYAADNATIINDAYKILRDPLKRANYLLNILFNINLNEDVNVDTEPELLLELMELNEEIELAGNDKDSILMLMENVQENIANIVERLKLSFEERNGAESRKLTIQYSYYNTVLAKLKSRSI